MSVYIQLYEGREDLSAEYFLGEGLKTPWLGPFDWIEGAHTVYLWCYENGQESLQLPWRNKMLFYQGAYYSDFKIRCMPEASANEAA